MRPRGPLAAAMPAGLRRRDDRPMTNLQLRTEAETSVLPWARVAALAAGTSAVALAVYQVATPGPPSAGYDDWSDWVREVLSMVFFLGTVGGAQGVARAGLVPQRPAALVSVGYGLIAVGVGIGMVLRDDPDWFMLLGGPGQILSTVGFVWLAVAGWRRGTLPGAVSLLAGVGGTVAFLGAEVGLSVIVAGFWFWAAAQLRR